MTHLYFSNGMFGRCFSNRLFFWIMMLICVLVMECLDDDAFIYALVMEYLDDVLIVDFFL